MQQKKCKKNKTTKMLFVVELQIMSTDKYHGNQRYFFFAAFLAFLAGAFFAGMVFITPFRS
jgi:hypothetical protein